MRICLLTNQDLDSPTIREDDWPCDPRPFLPEDDWHLAVLDGKYESVKQTEELIEEGFDLYFNLCDGAEDQLDLPGLEVIETLEKHGVPFVGATSACYEPSRKKVKDACKKHGIATPNYVYAKNEKDIEKAVKKLDFPLFVKHHNSYASVDITRASKVATPAGLRRQATKFISKHGASLIEEYIDGIECTVLVAERPDKPEQPRSYTPVQYEFPEGESFKHADLKFVEYQDLKTHPVPDKKLAKRLRKECETLFVELNAASFGRFDIRVDEHGTPFVLELNMNCGIYFEEDAYGSADFCLALDRWGHAGFTRQLVRAAFARNRQS